MDATAATCAMNHTSPSIALHHNCVPAKANAQTHADVAGGTSRCSQHSQHSPIAAAHSRSASVVWFAV